MRQSSPMPLTNPAPAAPPTGGPVALPLFAEESGEDDPPGVEDHSTFTPTLGHAPIVEGMLPVWQKQLRRENNRHKATRNRVVISRIRVHPRDLAVGDLIEQMGNMQYDTLHYRIVELGEFHIGPHGDSQREGKIMWTDGYEKGGTTEQRTFGKDGVRTYDVVGGPKLEAARLNPELAPMNGSGFRIWTPKESANA